MSMGKDPGRILTMLKESVQISISSRLNIRAQSKLLKQANNSACKAEMAKVKSKQPKPCKPESEQRAKNQPKPALLEEEFQAASV